MFVYKFLDIENYSLIRNELREYFKNITTQDIRNKTMSYLNKDEVFERCPLFRQYFEKIGKTKNKFVIIKLVLPPNYYHHPHIDNLYLHQLEPSYPNTTNFCLAFNFPIENCDDTYTIFYKYHGENLNILETIDVPDKPSFGVYRKLDPEQLEEIDRYYLDRPVLINTSVPHNINNTAYSTRITLNIRLAPDPWDLTK